MVCPRQQWSLSFENKALFARLLKSLFAQLLRSLFARLLRSLFTQLLRSLFARLLRSLFARLLKALFARLLDLCLHDRGSCRRNCLAPTCPSLLSVSLHLVNRPILDSRLAMHVSWIKSIVQLDGFALVGVLKELLFYIHWPHI